MSETATAALTLQLLAWLAEQPRCYGETMAAWRTSCPRLPVWEEAMADGLVELARAADGTMTRAAVRLTPRGRALLDGRGGGC